MRVCKNRGKIEISEINSAKIPVVHLRNLEKKEEKDR